MSLAPSPHKKQYATETNTKEQNINGARNEATQEAGIMMDVSQTQLEADTPRVELIKLKTKIPVGSWNVRTLYQAGKLQQVLQETDNYNIENKSGTSLLDLKPISDRLIKARLILNLQS